jgi:hypothetical protein
MLLLSKPPDTLTSLRAGSDAFSRLRRQTILDGLPKLKPPGRLVVRVCIDLPYLLEREKSWN